MRVHLVPHPDTPGSAGLSCIVDVERIGEDRLRLRYRLEGAIADVALAALSAPTRTDELWKHTCFEAFVRPADSDHYSEFNFSPSTRWAAYGFDSYRSGMSNLDVDDVRIVARRDADVFALETVIAAPRAGGIGLSAVIETISGEISYWSAAHAPGKPDFHHADNFAIDLRNI